ncbi:MAG: fatty acid--CoA ligase [Thermodesulfobacteriota bacterium]
MPKQPRRIVTTPSAYTYPLLIKQLLHTPLLYAADKEIVYRDKLRFTYKELYKRINRLASALTSLGVGAGDTVAVMDWDSHRYLECFFAIPGLGAIMHTVNIRLSPDQILYTMNHAEDDVVLVHEEFLPVLESIAPRLETAKTFILLKDGDETPTTSLPLAGEYEDLLSTASDSFDFPELDEDTQATTFYTTGTTGDPKGVYYSHRQLVLHTLGAAVGTSGFTSPARFQSADVYMPITPMFHVHAWGIPYLATMLGTKQVYPGRYEPAMLLQLLIKEKVTFSHCVPTILHMLLTSPAVKDVDLSGWKIVIGGAALSKGLAKLASDRGIEIFAGYGMSETCPILTLANLKSDMMNWDAEKLLDYKVLTGLPIPLVDLKVADISDGKEVPFDNKTPGEIVVRSPWLTQGYFKTPDKSEELWAGGWLHTGDIAVRTEDGYVRITDRLKDVIKTGGEWISSLQLESLISQHPDVSEVAVIGVPDEKWGERPLAMVVPKDPRAMGLEDGLRSFLQKFVDEGAISKWGIPDRFIVVAEIPKTSVGKTDKKVIKKGVAGGTYS